MPRSATAPLIVIGLDSAEAGLVRRWVEEGRLPTLAGLSERGAWLALDRPREMPDMPIWITVWSGMPMSRYGIYNRFQLAPGTYEFRTVTPHDAHCEPFWKYLRGAGKRAAIIDALDSNLVRDMPGIQVFNWAVHYALAPSATLPETLLEEVRSVYGAQIPTPERPESTLQEDRTTLQRMLERVKRKGALGRHLLGREPFDLAVLVFSEPHTAGHQFWKYGSASTAEAGLNGQAQMANGLRDIYQAIDRELGALLAEQPANANIVIVSPMGFMDQYPIGGFMEDFCVKLGYHVHQTDARNRLSPRALIRKALPLRWRHALRRLLPERTQAELGASKYAGITDWQRTTAFAIPSQYEGMLRINLRGREPQGIVEPGAEYEALLGRMTADLMQLIDPLTGRPAVEEVVCPALTEGSGPPEVLPDLVVFWNPMQGFQTRLTHPKATIRQEKSDFHRGTGHSRSGFAIAAGPDIAASGDQGTIDQLDLAPTFLALLGLPIPPDMPGQPAVFRQQPASIETMS